MINKRLNTARGKIQISYKERAIRLITDFSKNNGFQKTECTDCAEENTF